MYVRQLCRLASIIILDDMIKFIGREYNSK